MHRIIPFPRRFRRGLIEAGFIPPHRPAFPYFRGDSAAASLKRLASSTCRIPAPGFPRRFRRGLIEAGANVFGSAQAASRFPRRFRRGLIEAR